MNVIINLIKNNNIISTVLVKRLKRERAPHLLHPLQSWMPFVVCQRMNEINFGRVWDKAIESDSGKGCVTSLNCWLNFIAFSSGDYEQRRCCPEVDIPVNLCNAWSSSVRKGIQPPNNSKSVLFIIHNYYNSVCHPLTQLVPFFMGMLWNESINWWIMNNGKEDWNYYCWTPKGLRYLYKPQISSLTGI